MKNYKVKVQLINKKTHYLAVPKQIATLLQMQKGEYYDVFINNDSLDGNQLIFKKSK